MKRSFYTIGSLIILLIAAFIFVLVPIFSGGRTGATLPPFGYYDGTPIRFEQNSDYSNAVANIYNRYSEYYQREGRELPAGIAPYIYQIAFNETVKNLAYRKAVTKSGWKVPKTEVNRAIKASNYFNDEKNEFSQKLYNIAVREHPDAIKELRADYEKTLTAIRYSDDSFGGYTLLGGKELFGLHTSQKEFDFISSMNNGQSTFNVAVFNMSDYPDSEKAAFGKDNAEKFIKYDFSIITVNDKAKAASILKRINEEAITFEDAVGESIKAYSTDSGKINNKYHYQIQKFLSESSDMAKLTSLEAGAVSDVIKTTVGYSIFKADSSPVQPDFTDSQVLSTVYNYLNLNEASVIEQYYTKRAEDFAAAAKNGSFRNTANRFNASVSEIPQTALNYGNVSVLDKINADETGVYGLDTNETFLKKAFSLKNGEISEPVVSGQKILVVQKTAENLNAKDQAPKEAIEDAFKEYDNAASDSAILTSKKTVNNVSTVYGKYIQS